MGIPVGLLFCAISPEKTKCRKKQSYYRKKKRRKTMGKFKLFQKKPQICKIEGNNRDLTIELTSDYIFQYIEVIDDILKKQEDGNGICIMLKEKYIINKASATLHDFEVLHSNFFIEKQIGGVVGIITPNVYHALKEKFLDNMNGYLESHEKENIMCRIRVHKNFFQGVDYFILDEQVA